MTEPPDYVPGPWKRDDHRTVDAVPAPCRNPKCRCTHTPPCVAGWIDAPAPEPEKDAHGKPLLRDGEPVLHEVTRPCPTCRPEASRIRATTPSRHTQMRAIRERKEP